MPDKEALKIVLDMARKFTFARFMETMESKNPVKTSKDEASAIEIVSKKIGKKMDPQKDILP